MCQDEGDEDTPSSLSCLLTTLAPRLVGRDRFSSPGWSATYLTSVAWLGKGSDNQLLSSFAGNPRFFFIPRPSPVPLAVPAKILHPSAWSTSLLADALMLLGPPPPSTYSNPYPHTTSYPGCPRSLFGCPGPFPNVCPVLSGPLAGCWRAMFRSFSRIGSQKLLSLILCYRPGNRIILLKRPSPTRSGIWRACSCFLPPLFERNFTFFFFFFGSDGRRRSLYFCPPC